MNASPTSFAPPRVVPNQRHAFGGIWRLTFRRWLSPKQLLLTAGALAVLAGLSSVSIPHASPSAYFSWVGEFYLLVLVPILAFLSGAGAIRDDLKAGAVDYLFTRPVRRPAFVVFKYLSHLACVQLAYALALATLVAVGVYRDIPGLVGSVPLLLLAQLLTVTAFTALGFLCALLIARYLILGLLYAAIVEVGIGLIQSPINRLSITRQIRELLQPIIGSTFSHSTVSGVLGTTGLMLIFSCVFILVAALAFSLQEHTGSAARE